MTVDLEDIERTAVVGAGQMGRGIAAVSALGGYEVALCDVDEKQLSEAVEEIDSAMNTGRGSRWGRSSSRTTPARSS